MADVSITHLDQGARGEYHARVEGSDAIGMFGFAASMFFFALSAMAAQLRHPTERPEQRDRDEAAVSPRDRDEALAEAAGHRAEARGEFL